MKNGQYKDVDGTIRYYKNGKLHREDGPAVQYHKGRSVWLINGDIHREDGPAIEGGSAKPSWFILGKEITEEDFKQWVIKKKLNENLQQKLIPKLKDKKCKI